MTQRAHGGVLWLCLSAFAFAVAFSASAQGHHTLTDVRDRGYLRCGIDRSEPEYSSTDEHGSRAAFDRAICTAVAVAALGPQAHIVVTFYADDVTSMEALVEKKADVIASLSSNVEHTAWHEGPVYIGFASPILFDPVSMMVARSTGVSKAEQLSGKLICLLSETHTQDAVQSWFTLHNLDFAPFPFQEEGEMEAAFVTDRCAGLAGDRTRLLQTQHDTGSTADQYTILPEAFADDTLGIAGLRDDTEWMALVKLIRNTLFLAARLGLRSTNIHAIQTSDSAAMQSMVQTDADAARELKLRPAWDTEMIKAVGNYDELFSQVFRQAEGVRPLRANR